MPRMNVLMVKKDKQGNPVQAKSHTVVLGNKEETHWAKNDLFVPVIMKQSGRMFVAHGISLGC